MASVFQPTHRIMQMFDGKVQEYITDIENIHIWLEEIQQEANRMFSSDFSAEPELMPKTPSQKKSTRRRRVSSGRQEDNRAKRRFSKGKRSNLRGSSVKTLNLIAEVEGIPEATTSEVFSEEPKRKTRMTKQTQAKVAVDAGQPSHSICKTDQSPVLDEETVEEDVAENGRESDSSHQHLSDTFVPPQMTIPEVSVMISASDRMSAEMAKEPERSPGRSATKIAIAGTHKNLRRSSVRHSLTLRLSLAGLRHSMTQESIRRASRRSFLKKKARLGSSICSSNVSEDACMDTDGEEVEENKEKMSSEEPAETEKSEASPEERMKQSVQPSVGRVTRSKAHNPPTMAAPTSIISQEKVGMEDRGTDGSEKELACQSSPRSSQSGKRIATDVPEGSPRKKPSPPKKRQTSIRPNMKSFLHTVQKNQLLMMTPSSLGRNNVMKSFIKHTTPLRFDPKLPAGLVERERQKMEALRKKQEQEEERKKKMDEEKKRKQEEMKRKRDDRLRRVVEARVKEEQKEEEKKKKIELKMAQIDEKNDKLRVERLAEEKAKKKVATKRQEEIEQRRKLEEEARKKKIQQAEEEEVKQQKYLAKRRVEEEEQRTRKLAEARRAQELKEQELERERQAATERQRVEKEKALALKWELERAAREKERRELEEKRKALEEKRKMEEQQRLEEEEWAAKQREAATAAAAATAAKNVLNADVQLMKTPASKAAGLNVTIDIEHTLMKTPASKAAGPNVTIDIEQSPQSYELTPKGGNKPVVINPNNDDYGMDQNSDDSTDDESAPRKPIPSWAEGLNLKQAITKQYYHPLDLHSYFGEIEPPKLESIFLKSKPRYYKRTSSAVWNSPPQKAMY